MSDPLAKRSPRSALGGLRRQCLFAVTILLVEDSRSASEAIRLFAAESGARVRRADSLHAASRHLAIYRPNVVMVDLGLPDGDGMALDPPSRLGLDADRRHRRAERPRARRPGRPRRSTPAPPPAWRSRSRACAPSRNACSRSCPTPRRRRAARRARAGARRPRLGAAALEEDLRRARAPPRRGAAGRRRRDRRLLRPVRRLGRRDARRPRPRRRRPARAAAAGRRRPARRGCSTAGSRPRGVARAARWR